MIAAVAGGVDAAIRLPGRLRREFVWQLSPTRWRSHRALTPYHNIHWGERCFVIGNGPSLGRMDLSLLARETTFGLNRIYLAFEQLGFTTTYFLAVNRLVMEQFGEDIQQLPMPKFTMWENRHLTSSTPDVMYIRARRGPSFFADIRRGAWQNGTVTYVALQLAYFMGFQQVVLIGVDHSFKTKGTPNKEIVSQGDDPDHFMPSYFGKGVRWQLPDLETSEVAYRLAKERFERDGRSILDATIEGNLEVFQKVSYEEVVASTAPPKPFAPQDTGPARIPGPKIGD